MKILLSVLLGLVMLVQTGAFAQSDETATRRQFLENLGFNDISAEIRKRLLLNQYENELIRRQMEANAKSYEVVNASRDLALMIFEEVDRRELTPKRADALVELVAKMIALKPLPPPTNYPPNILEMEGSERAEAILRWLEVQRAPRMNEHKLRIVADITKTLYGDRYVNHEMQVKQIDSYVTTIVDRLYLDDLIGEGGFFGQALKVLLEREEQLRDRGLQLLKKLSRELRGRYNKNLELGDTLVLQTRNGPERVRVQNGSMMLTRTLATGSLNISWAAIPIQLGERWKARFKAMIGNPLAGLLYVDPEKARDGITITMRIKDRIAQLGVIREGYSHIAFVQVKEDAATGIKVVRLIDAYPRTAADLTGIYAGPGGSRITMYTDRVANNHHTAVVVARPDFNDTAEWFRKMHDTEGYQPTFAKGSELELEPDGVTPRLSQKSIERKTLITREEFEELNSERSNVRLGRQVWDRFTKGLEESIYKGSFFHWPENYPFDLAGAEYCKKLGADVMREYVGIRFDNLSKWHWGLRFLAQLGQLGKRLESSPSLRGAGKKLRSLPNVESAMSLVNLDISSPTTIAVAPFMSSKSYMLEYRTIEGRAESPYLKGLEYPADQESVRWLTDLELNNYEKRNQDPLESGEAGIREFEYGVITRGSMGIKTVKVEPHELADAAIQKSIPGIKKDWRANGRLNCARVLN